MQSETTTLLRRLALDRQSPPVRRSRTLRWTAAAALIAGTAGGLLWGLGAPAPPADAGAPLHAGAGTSSPHGSGPAAIAPGRALPREQAAPAERSASGQVLLNGTGYVVARRQATVSSKTTSRVTEVLIEEGMQVAAGQVLARLDDSNERVELELAVAQQAAAQAELGALDALLHNARQELARARALARESLVSQALVDERATEVDTLRARTERTYREIAVAAQRVRLHRIRLADLTIRAPFAGVIIEKSVQPGETISPVSAGGGFTRTGIGTIVDMSSLEVEIDVNESYINRITVDQPVAITLNAYPDRSYAGRVLAVIPTADRSKATIRVRIGFDATDERLLPEMGVKAAFLRFP